MMSASWEAEAQVSLNSMELPKKKNGEVDWHTLGNILVAHALGEVVCASYVDTKYGKKCQDIIPVTNWKYAYEEKGVVVLVKDMEDSPLKCFMGRSIVDFPPEVVHECISCNENALHWDKYAVESRLIECFRDEKDIQDGIGYVRHEAWQCLVKSKKDFLFYVRNQHLRENGKRVMSVLSVDYPSFPPIPGVDRGQLMLGSGWVLEPCEGDPSRTLVSYLAHANVCLPSLISNRVLQRQPLNIHYLQRYLSRPKPNTSLPTRKGKFSIFNKPKTSSMASDASSPDCSVVTPEIPTPDIFHDQTGYTFSAVTLGSNPLYNWSTSSTVVSEKDRKLTSEGSGDEDVDDCSSIQDSKKLEESESVLDFRITSIDCTSGKRVRPGLLLLPGLRNHHSNSQPTHKLCTATATAAAAAEVERDGERTDASLPSAESDSSAKGQRLGTHTDSGLTTRE